MKAAVIVEKVTPETTTCAACGVVFALPDYLIAKRREDGKDFFCPNGHCLVFDSEVERLKKQADQQKQKLSQAEADARWWREHAAREEEAHASTGRKLSATKGVLTRLKNRVHNGVCPCCNRSFENLQRHMKKLHPEWEPENDEPAP